MKIDLNFDAKALMARFQLTEKNLAYVSVNAINKTALQIQDQQRKNVRARFTLRKPDFVLKQAAIVKPFASVGQGRPYAEIYVGQRDRLLLSDFEHGGTRKPFIGKSVAVPITGSAARPGFGAPVDGAFRMTALGFRPTLTSSQRQQQRSIKGSNRKETSAMRKDYARAVAGKQVWKGRQHTYLIPGIGVFERTGPKKRDSRLIYKFKPNPQLRPTLGFIAMAQSEGQRWLADNLQGALIQELNRARR